MAYVVEILNNPSDMPMSKIYTMKSEYDAWEYAETLHRIYGIEAAIRIDERATYIDPYIFGNDHS